MLETKCDGGNYKMLVTVRTNVITNIHFLLTLASGVNIPKSSTTSLSLFPTSVTTFQVHLNFPTSARTFQLHRNFPTSEKTFQLRSILSNFAGFFPTSLGFFQLKQKLSNFRLSNLKLSNFSFFPTALSNYTYPV